MILNVHLLDTSCASSTHTRDPVSCLDSILIHGTIRNYNKGKLGPFSSNLLFPQHAEFPPLFVQIPPILNNSFHITNCHVTK